MTFGEYVINLRRRLQDLRSNYGAIITSIGDDGVRYSSDHIISIANMALVETTRLIYAYSDSPLLKQIGSDVILAENAVTALAGGYDLPDNVLAVVSVVTQGVDTTEPYVPISGEEYYNFLKGQYSPRSEGKYFAEIFNVSTLKTRLRLIPATTANIIYTYIMKRDNYTSADSNVELFLQGIDDFILDVAEKEARKREGDKEQFALLQTEIALKLGKGGK